MPDGEVKDSSLTYQVGKDAGMAEAKVESLLSEDKKFGEFLGTLSKRVDEVEAVLGHLQGEIQTLKQAQEKDESLWARLNRKSRRFKIGVAIVALLLVGGAGYYFWFGSPRGSSSRGSSWQELEKSIQKELQSPTQTPKKEQ